MKVVYSPRFGGYGISKEGMLLYYKKKGLVVHAYSSKDAWSFDYFFDEPAPDYVVESLGKSNKAAHVWMEEHQLINYYDIPRHDPALVEMVEELGSEKASSRFADLKIAIITGTQYRIDEYDGNESVETPDNQEWTTV